MSKEIPIVKTSELASVSNNFLNGEQLSRILKRTPTKYLKKRPAKGGGEWTFVSGGYVRKCLNILFGWDWYFEILEQLIIHDEAVVKGKLTIRCNGRTIVKTQFGNKDIMYKRGTEKPLSIGNDLKAAATDALKKCASEIGIAADVYNSQEFEALTNIVNDDVTLKTITDLFELKRNVISENDLPNYERIINNQETDKYKFLYNQLKSIK